MDGRNRIAHMKKINLQLETYFELRKEGEILYLQSIAASLAACIDYSGQCDIDNVQYIIVNVTTRHCESLTRINISVAYYPCLPPSNPAAKIKV